MQSFKMRIADKNAAILKEQFLSQNFNYQLFRIVKKNVKVQVNQYQYYIERREWYDVVVTTNQKWNEKHKKYFKFLENHNFISHFEII